MKAVLNISSMELTSENGMPDFRKDKQNRFFIAISKREIPNIAVSQKGGKSGTAFPAEHSTGLATFRN